MRSEHNLPGYVLEDDIPTGDEFQEDVVNEVAGDIVTDLQGAIRENTFQYKVFALLSDRQWHCRICEGKNVGSSQYAGGGGIQGLQGATNKREGLEIEKERRDCERCGKKTTQDRWTGRTKKAGAATNIPPKLVTKILEAYKRQDAIEDREREPHELVVDHRFPLLRWDEKERPHNPEMSVIEIKKKFQLLKKDQSGNHNLLKSRACEHCVKHKERGTPLNINFWYTGGKDWPVEAVRGPEAEAGCHGCGWYDFQAWREALNKHLADTSE